MIRRRRKSNQTPAGSAPAPAEHFFRDVSIEFLIHELKDPISIIETGVRTLLERPEKYGPLTERQEKTLERVLRNSRKARSMLHDLLEIGRSEAGQCVCCRFEAVKAVREVLVEALETASRPHSVEGLDATAPEAEVDRFLVECGVFLDIGEEVFRAELLQDETKFRQILGNLVKNAVHHRKRRVDVRVRRLHRSLVVEVADDGPGIEARHHEAIFRRYTQVAAPGEVPRKGHGLGLAGALILSRCLGGSIDIESQPGQGATFRLTLPVTYRQDAPV